MLCRSQCVWFTLCMEHSVTREKGASFPPVSTAKLWTKLKCWMPAQYSSCYAKLPSHTPLSEPKATPQPSSLKQVSEHSGLSPPFLFYLTSGWFFVHIQIKEFAFTHTHRLPHTLYNCRFILLTIPRKRDAFPLTGMEDWTSSHCCHLNKKAKVV